MEPGADPEWWERLRDRWLRWLGANPRRTKAMVVASAVAVLVLVIAAATEKRFGDGVHIWLPCWLMLLGWLLLAPTKTVRWTSVLRLFSISALWAVAVAWLATRVAHGLALSVDAPGPSIGVAGALEETLKLAPLAVLGVLAPGRVRRFGAIDWALAGLACGMGFQASEDFVRQATSRPTLLNPGGADWNYGWTLFGGRFDIGHIASYPGHHIETGLVAIGIGLAVRARGRRARWRGLWAWALPFALWLMVVCDHVAFNATAADETAFPSGRSTVPTFVRTVWSWTGHGFNRGWLLLGLMAIGLLADARSQAATGAGRAVFAAGPAGPAGPAVPRPPILERLAAAAADAIRSLFEAVARSFRAVGWAARRTDGAPGRVRLTTMLGALAAERRRRELDGAPFRPGRPWLTTRLVIGITGSLSTVLGVLVARSLAQSIGDTLQAADGNWFAGLLDGLGDWWNGLGPGGQALVIAGALALILLGGFLLFPELLGGEAIVAAEEEAIVAEETAAAEAEGAAAAEEGSAAAEEGSAAAEEGSAAAEQARLNDLAKDPAHGGRITEGSMEEAQAARGLEESGQLRGVRRDPTGAADFLDESGQAWDVKGFNSNYPNGYDVESATTKIGTSLRDGENVVLDTRKMSPADVAELRSAVEGQARWLGKVLWWP